MEDEILRRRTDELVKEMYGEGSPVSEEEIGWLVNGLRHNRGMLAYYLVKSSELTGFSPSELIEMLEVDIKTPKYYEHVISEFFFICKNLHRKGYGSEIQRVLTTENMFGREGDEPFPSVVSMVNASEWMRLKDFVFNLPDAKNG